MKKIEHNLEPRTLVLESEKAYFPKIEFESITKKLVHLSGQRVIHCPNCGKSIDFSSGLEWFGPSHFMCIHCVKLVNLSAIAKEYHDLLFIWVALISVVFSTSCMYSKISLMSNHWLLDYFVLAVQFLHLLNHLQFHN